MRLARPDDTGSWIALPGENRHQQLHSASRPDNSRGSGQSHAPVTYNPNPPRNAANVSTEPIFFCTFCAEEGERKTCKTKQDWKRHEQDFHETGNAWLCQVAECSAIFYCGGDFKKHFDKQHGGQGKLGENKKIQQRQLVYGCGFETCRKINFNWKSHCDHVAEDMREGQTEWNYTRTIRNLLRYPTLSGPWKSTYSRLSPQVGILHSQLTWDPKTTREMREQLEYHNFEPDLASFLERLFWRGCPEELSRAFAASALPQPSYSLPPLPADASSNIQGPPATFGDSMQYDMIDPSLDLASTIALNHTGEARVEAPTYPYRSRNSVIMVDAPPPSGAVVPNSAQDQEMQVTASSGRDRPTWQEFVLYDLPTYAADTPTYAANTTPPLEPPVTDESNSPGTHSRERSGPRRKLMRKSKEWLTSKRSQHFHTMDHPDLPPNMQLPGSLPRKPSSNSPPAAGTDRLYSYQS